MLYLPLDYVIEGLLVLTSDMAPISPILTPGDFHFSSMETEDMTRYVPGGYHPIVIGDILSPSSKESKSGARQYRIVHKLGFGSWGGQCG